MLKYADIHKAIVDKLKSKFENIYITSTDIAEGFNRPSFFISFDNVNTADFMNKTIDRNITVRIYYFPSDIYKNKVEILDVQDSLEDIFVRENLTIDNIITQVQELNFEIVDRVLNCTFEISLYEEYERVSQNDNDELMQELEFE